MTDAQKLEVAKLLQKYIYDQLNTPVARRSRFLLVLSQDNSVLKVRWDK